MSQRNIGGLFVRKLIRMFILILILFAFGYGSYFLTISYFKVTHGYESQKSESSHETIVKAIAEQTAKNLIYSVDPGTGRIQEMLLEVFHADTKKVTIVKIPVEIQYTMSTDLYESLSKVNGNIPQTLKLSSTYEFFDEAMVFEYTTKVMNELLGVDASFYTALRTSDYQAMFQDGKVTEAFLETICSLNDAQAVQDYMVSYYEKVQTNLTLKKRLTYANYYAGLQQNDIAYETIKGHEEGQCYVIDPNTVREQIKDIVENSNDSASITEDSIDDNNTTTDSRGLQIQILNGSGKSGLAAAFQDKLIAAGYTVNNVGNYSLSSEEHTRILTSKEGTGTDLVSYFRNATVEAGNVEAQYDITIILGRDDAN